MLRRMLLQEVRVGTRHWRSRSTTPKVAVVKNYLGNNLGRGKDPGAGVMEWGKRRGFGGICGRRG